MFLNEENYINKKNGPNIAHFEVATSTVCLPRIVFCEVSILILNYKDKINNTIIVSCTFCINSILLDITIFIKNSNKN